MHVCACVYLCMLCICKCVYVCTCIRMCVFVYECMCVHVCVCVCVCVCVQQEDLRRRVQGVAVLRPYLRSTAGCLPKKAPACLARNPGCRSLHTSQAAKVRLHRSLAQARLQKPTHKAKHASQAT